MNRPLIAVIVGLVVVVAAIGLNYLAVDDDLLAPPERPQSLGEGTKPVVVSPEPPPTEPTAETAQTPPSFDVVRVNPQGDTVIAGRAMPGSRVVILDDGKPIGEVTADANGEWVFLPENPLPPGNRQLSLEMHLKQGGLTLPSQSVVVLVVPERDQDIAGRPAEAGESGALALAVPREGHAASRILQAPSTPGTDFELRVEAVDYDDAGNLAISGHAQPGATVQLYLDKEFIGRAAADENGRWSLSPDTSAPPGLYTLRADHVDDKGKVLARVSFPFARSEPITDMAPGTFVVVQPGNSLWRLARQVYGSGFRYTVIFKANAEQIGDPDLIYPGQVFSLPKDNPAGH